MAVPENIRDIEEARGHGDLSENAEYTAAKERQAYLPLTAYCGAGKQSRHSDIIDLSNLTTDKVVSVLSSSFRISIRATIRPITSWSHWNPT